MQKSRAIYTEIWAICTGIWGYLCCIIF